MFKRVILPLLIILQALGTPVASANLQSHGSHSEKKILVEELHLYKFLQAIKIEIQKNVVDNHMELLVEEALSSNPERIINESIKLLEGIIAGFNGGCFSYNPEIEYKFVNMCNFLSDTDIIDIEPYALRALIKKIQKFDTYIKAYCDRRKVSLQTREHDLFDKMTKFNYMLLQSLLCEEYLNFGWGDEIADWMVYRPLEFIAEHKALTFVAALAASGLIYFYIAKPWLDGALAKPFAAHAGLKNLGNTCFFNATTQVLFSMPLLTTLLLAKRDKIVQSQDPKDAALRNYISLAEELRTNKGGVIKPTNRFNTVMDALGFDEESKKRQQDAQEFLMGILDRIDESAIDSDNELSAQFSLQEDVERVCSSRHGKHITENGTMLSTEVQKFTTLEQCLGSYSSPGALTGDNQLRCEACGDTLCDGQERRTLRAIPPYLIVHLKRFEFDRASEKTNKLDHGISFPLQGLNLNPYLLEGQPEALPYDLIGIILHAGMYGNGHYIAFAKSDEQWNYYDDDEAFGDQDDVVAKVCETGLYKGGFTPYILVYQRRVS